MQQRPTKHESTPSARAGLEPLVNKKVEESWSHGRLFLPSLLVFGSYSRPLAPVFAKVGAWARFPIVGDLVAADPSRIRLASAPPSVY